MKADFCELSDYVRKKAFYFTNDIIFQIKSFIMN